MRDLFLNWHPLAQALSKLQVAVMSGGLEVVTDEILAHWPPQHGLKAMTWFCTLCTGYGTSFLNWPHGNNLMIGSSVRTYAKTSCSSFAPVPLCLLFGLELARSASVVSSSSGSREASFFYRFSFHTVLRQEWNLDRNNNKPCRTQIEIQRFQAEIYCYLRGLGQRMRFHPSDT